MPLHPLESTLDTITLVHLDRTNHGDTGLFPGDSHYVEFVYGGVLGPSATLIYRRLCWYLTDASRPIRIEVDELAATFGIKRSVALRSLQRLVDFHFAEWHGTEFAVHTSVPAVPERLLQRLSTSVIRFHIEALRHWSGVGT